MTRVPSREGAILLLAALLIGFVVIPFANKGDERSETTTSVDEVRAILAKCSDARNCVGGFIRTKKGYTFRIELCGESCGRLSMNPWSIYGQQLLYRDGIEHVMLPRDPGWHQAAMFYAEQFVDPSQSKKP